ncbi:S9 family peptidase [Sesbania bispinosa]|nr:S9 family peptidase [Sesbania bispinosa]
MVNEGTWGGWEGGAYMVAKSRRRGTQQLLEGGIATANAQWKAEQRAHGRRPDEGRDGGQASAATVARRVQRRWPGECSDGAWTSAVTAPGRAR